jgi:hypothetical protein
VIKRQLVKNNLYKLIIDRFSSLSSKEEELYLRLSTTAPYHPRRALHVKLPKTLRKLWALWVRREQLPARVRIEIERTFEAKVAKSSPSELQQLAKLNSYLEPPRNERFLNGRFNELLLKSLLEVQIYLSDPKRPKRKVRRRGYRDGRGSGKANSLSERKARIEAEEIARREKQYLYLEARDRELAAAEMILMRERTGESAQAISAEPSAAQEAAESARILSDAFEVTPPVVQKEKEKRGNSGLEFLLNAARSVAPGSADKDSTT